MKPETLVKKIIEAMETNSSTLITYNGKKVHITQKIIDKYNCKVRDDIDLERIDENLTKKGGFLPFLPLIFAGLAAAVATAGGAAGIAKAVNDKKAEAAANAEARRHNLAMERGARGGSRVGDILGRVKEFGQRFGEETKKTVKEGLSKLIDKIDTGEMKISILCISTQNTRAIVFLKALEYLPKKDVQDIFQYYEENEEEVEIKDIIENFIKSKNPSFNPTDIKVFLTKNVNDLDLSNIDSNRKNLILFDDCVAQRNQTVQQESFTKGRHHNCHCIYQSQSFYGMDSMFIRKNANCYLLFELNDKDLSQIIQSINHGMDRDTFKKKSDDYAEDYPPIIQEIDEFDDMVASGQSITFLSDDNKELLNRLEIILAAMKEGHRSDRQYNEVNAILKRLLEKEIITKKDYINVIKNVQ
ncbi:hypothetical protein LOTGIDRAFT_168969 [Lottia gigantea]|uniref:Uncharacterized protein n=1 Tax=Lottia gigantea TaxID=225164 RepID=V3ZS53_LOTGI|nr:hypothetical protein LOTGIDRAFT_168969 [Lottia gigantea]ESO83726.1 hypothetical protein LOTGIDRAFT_168969 [Lottia gigantea]